MVMRITGWSIDGFGIFNGAQVTDLPEGLTVVYGPNEAGKSTTLAFIRGVLFGFPKGRTNARKYPPLNGGRHGGRLFLHDAEGSWTIERTGSSSSSLTVTPPDGSAGTKEDLARLMAFAGREIFRNIFAFDLDDLDMRSLDSDAVKDRVFASTQTGAGVSPSQAKKALGARMAKLLKPRARGVLINDLRYALADVDREISAAQKAAAGYPKAVSERDRLSRAVVDAREEHRKAAADVLRFEKLESLWPDWRKRQQHEEELAQIDAPDNVPEDIVERFTETNAAIREATRAQGTIQKELADHNKRLARIELDGRLLNVGDEAEALFAGASAYEQNVERLSARERDARQEREKVRYALTQLGPDWNRERIVSLDTSIPAASEVTSWSDAMHDAESAQEEAARALDDASRRAGELRDEQSRLEKEVHDCGEVPSEQELDELESGIGNLKAMIAERGTAEAHVENAEQTAANLSMSAGPAAGVAGAAKSMRSALYGFAALLAVASVAMAAIGQVPAGAVLAVAAVGAAALGYRAGYIARHDVPLSGGEPADPRVEHAADVLTTRRSDLARIEKELRSLAHRLNVPEAPTPLHGEGLSRSLSRQREQRATLDRLSADLAAVEKRKHRADEDVRSCESTLRNATADAESTTGNWNTWRAERGIPEPMPPDTVTAVFQEVRACRQAIDHLDQVEETARDLRGAIEEFERRADAALAAAGDEPGVRSSALGTALAALHEKVLADRKLRADKEGLETAIEKTTEDIERAGKELEAATEERDGVLAEVSAADESDLREIVRRADQRKQLEAKIHGCTERIDTSLGLGSEAEKMRAELAGGQVDEWKNGRLEAQTRVRELDGEIEEAVRAHENAIRELRTLSESSDINQLEVTREGLRHEIAEAVGQWQRLAIARALIDETVTLFEKKNQGPVVDRASSLFEKITHGHYPRLLAHEGSIKVEDDKGARVSVADLSTGAAQQVYLCLRLSLAEEEASRRTSLPLIMDEVLVNFDPERSLGVAEAIGDVATRHQVLMFTCHPGTVDLLQTTCGDTRVVELERFVGSPH